MGGGGERERERDKKRLLELYSITGGADRGCHTACEMTTSSVLAFLVSPAFGCLRAWITLTPRACSLIKTLVAWQVGASARTPRIRSLLPS
jgi:hypothetical protein